MPREQRRQPANHKPSIEIEVESSVELVSSSIFLSSRARPAYEQKRAEHERRVAEQIASAGGRTIVRERDPMGQCRFIGALTRETPQFYVIESTTLIGDQDAGVRRVSKSGRHLEACPRCPDHLDPVVGLTRPAN